jgi:hypothetical protein
MKIAKRILSGLMLTIILIASLICPNLETQAAIVPPAPPVTSYSTFFSSFGSLFTLKGVFGSTDYYFSADKNWNLKVVTLHLDITQSQIIDSKQLSTMTIYLNSEPIQSLYLNKYMASHSVIDLPIDISKVKVGVNSLRIQVYRRMTDNSCADNDSNANWVNINADSGVNINYIDTAPAMSISQYPYPFFKMQQNSQLNTAVTVADNAGAGEMQSALELDSDFGRYAGSNDISLTTSFLSDLAAKNQNNIIYIGKPSDTPKALMNNFPSGAAFADGAALKLIQSPYDKGHVMLLIVAQNDSDLTRAVKFLDNDSLVSQVFSDYYYLNSSVDVLTKDQPQSSNFSFSSLGSNGVYVAGPDLQNAQLAIKFPKNRVIDGQSKLTLNYRYSANLDFNRASVNVYINDIPVGSKALSQIKANGDTFTLNIPSDALNGNYFNLRIAFDLQTSGGGCVTKQQDMPWAYVLPNSNIDLPTTNVLTNLFDNFPNPFVSDNQWNNTLFVLPKQADSEDLNNAGIVSVLMGHEINSNHGSLQVAIGDTSSKNLALNNLFVIGTPARQNLITANNSSLYFKYDSGFNYFVSNEKLELLPDYSKTLVSFQLLNSPYNSKLAMFVLTSPDGGRLTSEIKAFFQPSKFSALVGDGALIDPDGNVASYRFKKETIIKPQFWSNNINTNTRIFMIVAAFVLLLIVITLILFRRKNKNMLIRHQKPDKK